MKKFVVPALALGATAAMAQQAKKSPAPIDPQVELQTPRDAAPENCDDRITQVRAANGHPKLDRGTSSEEDAKFIAAVDLRIGDCSVMVMREDTSDIRPLPKRSDEIRIRKID
ncbi:hypothetical protein K3152_03615 [Qipengyuania sp. 1NDH17]|uniref:Uncharacterized protein n=1 Tax=Qipengyuania polymorpha TaxID=2867234 RepID=A0ABS7IV97_9SPHN|nr:hypothetical protein [Qipengyuania polymorpha]MBX7457325.1 hypothetical protein [Qipengyuania polymorpha]